MHLRRQTLALLLLMTLTQSGCSGTAPTNLGIHNQQLTACPSSPNCVVSDTAPGNTHYISPIQLNAPAATTWQAALDYWRGQSDIRVITTGKDYFYAESSSTVFGFVDDVEMHLRPGQGIIAIRSAARLGHADFGVNRNRLEALRETLEKQALAK